MRPYGTAESVAFSDANAARIRDALCGFALFYSDLTGLTWKLKGLADGGRHVGWALVASDGSRTDLRIEGGTLTAVSITRDRPEPHVQRINVPPTFAAIARAVEQVLLPEGAAAR